MELISKMSWQHTDDKKSENSSDWFGLELENDFPLDDSFFSVIEDLPNGPHTSHHAGSGFFQESQTSTSNISGSDDGDDDEDDDDDDCDDDDDSTNFKKKR
jgi:hypothetical protein